MPVPYHNSMSIKPLASPRRVFLILLVGFIMLFLGQAPFAEEGKQSEAEKKEELKIFQRAKEEFIDEEQIALRKALLTKQLFQNRRDQIYFKRAKEALQKKNPKLALRYLHYLLSIKSDQFVWDDKSHSIRSLRKEIGKLIVSQKGKLLQLYEERYDGEAADLLQDAKASRDFSKYHEIVQRFFYTKAGFEAAHQIAIQQFDRGYFGEAARMWNRLITSPRHQRRITSTFLLRTAIAYQRAGDNETALQIAKQMKRKPAYLKKQKLYKADVIALLQSHRFVSEKQPLASDWKIPGGSPLRHRRVHASAPFLKANWVSRLGSKGDPLWREFVLTWEGKQQIAMKSIAVQSNTVVSGDKIIVRTLRGIECRQLSTGKIIWKFRDVVLSEHLQIFATKSGCLGGLSGSHQTVYAIDDIEFTVDFRPGGIHMDVKTQNKTNRLIALSLSPKNLSHSPSHPFIQWSIGGKPGVPLWFYRKDHNGDHVVSQREFAGSKQAFQKLDTNSSLTISQEEAVASSPKRKPHPLANHFFLGPPLPVSDKLFVMTYYDGVISLNILHAETGRLISQQKTVSLSGEMEAVHKNLLLQGVQMSYANGIVVCPVLPDLLIGIDVIQGKLLWVSDKLKSNKEAYRATDRLNPFERVNLSSHAKIQTHSGYPSMPLIEGNRIYHLPRGSNSIYCFDLFTGKKIWSARREGAQYLAAITDKTLFVVGNKHYKSLDKTTGETIWKKPTSIPSGTGVFTGKHYLLPLQEGRVATIDVRTGETFGFALLPGNPVQREKQTLTRQNKLPQWSPGNLIAANGKIISTNLREVAIFSQVDLLHQQLAQKKIQSTLSASDHLVLAELYLLSGNTQDSRTELNPFVISQLNPTQITRARKIQREILYLDLKNPSNNLNAILTQLDRFSKTPAERGRYLMQKGEIRLQQKDFAGLMRTTREYAQLPLTDPLPVIGDPTMLVSARSWIPRIIDRAKQKWGADTVLQNRRFLNKEIRDVLSSNNQKKLEQFLYVYNDWAEAAAVRQQLAQMVLKQGEYQRAEFLLLKNRHSNNKQIAANATYLLFKLYQQLGLSVDAARMLSQIEKKYSTITLFDGVTGTKLIKQFPRNSLVWNCYQQQQPLAWNVQRVAVTGKTWLDSDPELQETYSQHRRIIQVPASFPFTLLEKRKRGANQLTVIDRATGVVKGEIPTGAISSQYPQLHHLPTEGHFFPMVKASRSGQYKIGISLLQLQTPKPLWRKKPTYYGTGSNYYRAGPSGILFATFQSSRQLVVLDPATGDLLWSRKKLPEQSGLHFNAMYGLIGDEKVLVMFHGSHYTVYNTQTGDEIRKGSLPISPSVRPRVFGRKLFFQKMPYGDHKGELVLWDPIDNKNLLSQFSPSSRKEYESELNKEHKSYSMLYKIAVTPENELVTLTGNKLQIFDIKNKVVKRKIKISLPNISASKVQYLRAFQQGGVYFINIQTNNRRFGRFKNRFGRALRSTHFQQTATSDALVPAIHLQGELIAIDAKTSRVLWKKTVEPMSILQITQHRLPFLVTMARLRNRQAGSQQSLSIEIIDVQTGETIGKNDNLFSDRIVQLTYNREKERLELYGLRTRVDLDFSRRQQRLAE